MNITLNPYYILKQDDGCVLLLTKKTLADAEGVFEDSINSVIHPFHAKILSYVNGGDYEETITKISSELDIKKDRVKYFIDSLIENPKRIGPVYKSTIIGFPRHTIIKSDYKRPKPYTLSDFDYDPLIPLERIAEIVKEARKIGVVNFDLIGGEVFKYKKWRELVKHPDVNCPYAPTPKNDIKL